MKAIVTVTGIDHTGIVAAAANALAELDTNILNMSQTLMDDYFTMILQCEFDDIVQPIGTLQERLSVVGEEQKLDIRIQSEAIFDAMHRL